ncbi:MAG TPA: DUF3592 domain-containing protein [Anaerolineales bacterium]|nr:DUF3592 domain-containing protein [Anaerolineales bacterium]
MMKLRILGIFVLIFGVLLAVMLISSMWVDVPIWFFGEKVTATVEEKWWEILDFEEDNRDQLTYEYFFQYQFTTSDGKTVSGTSKMTEEEFLNVEPGGAITVKYSRLDPSQNRVDDSRFVPFHICSYAVFIVICLFALAAGREMIDF